MFNEAEYQTVWMIYLAAAACCWLVWTQLTRWVGWWFIREPLWLVMAVILFTPAQIDPLEPWLAPAVIGLALDTLLGSGENAGKLLGELVLVMALAALAYIGFACLRLGWRHWRSGRSSSAA
ncbi:MFS transporter [Pseudomonas sp. MYb185]|uniref:MFS transporter n=1 Tax=Pseudomonas sp. MYb185 TaxID=1848729 RepID=UPI000CFB1DAE|nr:MFS transporter [Pseudomonas sp. MYb185]PRB82174.1 MFS transporter [Pseudomonas sp. MYb185]